MAVGYFTRAVRRAAFAAPGSSPSAAAPVGFQPAAPIASPLTEADQRLHLVDGAEPRFTAGAWADSADTDPDQHTTAASAGDRPPSAAESSGTPSARAEPHGTLPAPGSTESAHRRVRTRVRLNPDAPRMPGDETDDGKGVDARRPVPPTSSPRSASDTNTAATAPPETPDQGRPRPSSPMAEMMRALAAAERWVADGPNREDAAVDEALPRQAPVQADNRGEIIPVLPRNAEPAGQLENAPPEVVIDNLVVEIVAPPAAASPPPAATRAVPVKTTPRPAMPFGWRQR